jgi:ubiquinone/menaquinone biosynthesis C-methylase UbiE
VRHRGYFELVRAAGRRVVGIDQSAGMLAQAHARGIATRLERVGLQELAVDAEFDAAMTIDAMENVPPEDWPVVLANLHRAVRPGAHIYLTVEETDDGAIDTAFEATRAQGLPAVRGEIIEGDTAGYHYYPGREQVLRWLTPRAWTLWPRRTTRRTDGVTATCSCKVARSVQPPGFLTRAETDARVFGS